MPIPISHRLFCFRTCILRVFILFCCISSPSVQADQLDDDLQTVWEALWDQRGTPRQILRWDISKTVTYSISGPAAAQNKDHLLKALEAVSQASGVRFIDILVPQNVPTQIMLDIEVVKDSDIEPTMPCFVRNLRWRNFMLEKVAMKMGARHAWQCSFHEMMHAMGIAGHPSGKTVLSYFPYRRDVLMDIDKLMLATIYASDMPSGATPLEALQILAKQVAAQPQLRLAPTIAQERASAFLEQTKLAMKQFAQGQGDIPSIIRRSGRASESHIANARAEMAYFLGLTAARDTLALRNLGEAYKWFALAANAGHARAQLYLGRAYKYGIGVDILIDKAQAIAWLTKAASSGIPEAKLELTNLMAAKNTLVLPAATPTPPTATTTAESTKP